MTCPTCGGELVTGAERCAVCDAPSVPRTEGALATDPRLVTPAARGKARADAADGARAEPIREIPGLRRREPRPERNVRDESEDRSWRDEVQARIRSRRQKRTEAGLPLFEQEVVHSVPAVAEVPSAGSTAPAPQPAPVSVAPSSVRPASRAERVVAPLVEPGDPDVFSPGLSEAELADLPLQTAVLGPAPAQAGREREPELLQRSQARPAPPPLDEVLLEDGDLDPGLDLEPPRPEPAPLERPAHAGERAQAAAFDLALFAAIASVVVYFAGRAARVEMPALAASWPWLLGFLGLLAAFYACYFTGTTGQTPGKLITGLQVVDVGGRPPGHGRATARALVGLLGVAVVGLGLVPIAFDPAGRALHDRLFRTRVVRR